MSGPLLAHELVVARAPLEKILAATKTHPGWTHERFEAHKTHELSLVPPPPWWRATLWHSRFVCNKINSFFCRNGKDRSIDFLWLGATSMLICLMIIFCFTPKPWDVQTILTGSAAEAVISFGIIGLCMWALAAAFFGAHLLSWRIHDYKFLGPAKWQSTSALSVEELQWLPIPLWVKAIAHEVAALLPGTVFVLHELRAGEFTLDPALEAFMVDPAKTHPNYDYGVVEDRILCVWKDDEPVLPQY